MTAVPLISNRPKSFLAELQERLQAIAPDMYRTPKREQGMGETIVGTATDHLKQLYTFAGNVREEMKPLQTEYQQLYNEMMGFMRLGRVWQFVHAILGKLDEFRKKADRLRELEMQLTVVTNESAVVEAIFWIEARRQYPELNEPGRSIWVDTNWNFSWSEGGHDGRAPQGILVRRTV
jgi:hypothetical protein